MALNKTIRKNFERAFEQKCFNLIIEAYQTALLENVIQLEWNENDISYELCEIIEQNPRRIEKYKIHLSPEYRLFKNTFKTKGFADKMPRIDLRMSHFAMQNEFKYFFEAKRLKEKDSSLKRAYIDDGIDRFITDKYPLGCMLGYLLYGKVDKTIIGINRLLQKDERETEILHPKPLARVKNYCESTHPKNKMLRHIILDLTSIYGTE